MKTLSVKLPEPLAKWLEAEAARVRRSRSQIVRDALEQCKGAGTNRKGKERSMADALCSLGGTLNGPRDLSTNPKYMEGFGESLRSP